MWAADQYGRDPAEILAEREGDPLESQTYTLAEGCSRTTPEKTTDEAQRFASFN